MPPVSDVRWPQAARRRPDHQTRLSDRSYRRPTRCSNGGQHGPWGHNRSRLSHRYDRWLKLFYPPTARARPKGPADLLSTENAGCERHPGL